MPANTPRMDDDLRLLSDAARDLVNHLDRLSQSGGSLPGEQLQRIQAALVSLKAIVEEETQKHTAEKPSQPAPASKRKASAGKSAQSRSTPKRKASAGKPAQSGPAPKRKASRK